MHLLASELRGAIMEKQRWQDVTTSGYWPLRDLFVKQVGGFDSFPPSRQCRSHSAMPQCHLCHGEGDEETWVALRSE